MILLAELIRTIPKIGAAHHTVFGVLLIVVIIFLPNGVVGDFGEAAAAAAHREALVSALLEVRGVSRFFGGLAALTDVSFSIDEG